MDADFLLIHKMKNGDEEAIEVFVKKYYSTIRNYCRLHTYTDCDAEDITQAMGQVYKTIMVSITRNHTTVVIREM